MPLREIASREKELTAQYDALGVPEDDELKNSENVIWIEEYTRDDGTKVSGHWRSLPDSGEENSEISNNDDGQQMNNVSENTEKQGQYIETEEYKKSYREKEKQKSIERKDPDVIAGVKRGEPMTFEEMVNSSVNPSFEYENIDSGNCQCCVGAAEMRRRGFNVSAVNRNDNPFAEKLVHDSFGLWLNPQTGNKCEPYEIDVNKENCFEYLDALVKADERYSFAYYAPKDDIIDSMNESGKLYGHVVTIDRCESGELRYYDPQTGEIHIGEDAKAYIDSWTAPPVMPSANPQILRIDDKKINPYYQNNIFVKHK